MKLHSVASRILLLVALFLLVGFSVVVTMNALQSSAAAKEAALSEVRNVVDLEVRKLAQFLYGPYNGVLSLASTMGALPGADEVPRPRQFSSERVRETLQRYPTLKGVFVEWEPNVLDGLDSEYVGRPGGSDEDGTAGTYWVREADGKETVIWGSTGVDSEPYYTEPKTTGKPALIDPYVDEDTGVLMATISAPVTQRGRFVGVAGADIALAGLRDWASAVRPFETGYMTIYAGNGDVLAGPDGLEVGKPDPNLPANVQEAITAGREEQYSEGAWQHMIRPVMIEGLDKPWMVRISASSDVVYAASRAATMRAILMSAVIGLATLAVLGWFILRTMHPLGRLSSTFTDLASGQGDLTQRLDMGDGQDEISTLARSFDRFSQSLRKMLIDVRECAGKLNGSALEVDRETDEIGQHCAQQAQSSLSTASSVHQLFTSISRVAESSSHAGEITRSASSAAEKVAEDVHGVAREVGQVVEAISRVDDVLGKLRQRSEEIGSVVQVIRDIADQTNLLALNAAIEAARAGEQGRGFAVVADEVRKLAERSASATQEISNSITQVQNETNEASASMTQAVEQVQSSVKLAERAAESVDIIRRSNDEVLDVIEHAAQASAEQSEASQSISDAVENINEMSGHTERSLTHARENVVACRELAERLQTMIAKFKL